jgi:hypothetical protein
MWGRVGMPLGISVGTSGDDHGDTWGRSGDEWGQTGEGPPLHGIARSPRRWGEKRKSTGRSACATRVIDWDALCKSFRRWDDGRGEGTRSGESGHRGSESPNRSEPRQIGMRCVSPLDVGMTGEGRGQDRVNRGIGWSGNLEAQARAPAVHGFRLGRSAAAQ